MTLDMKQQIDECAKVWRSFLYFLDTWVFIEDKENKRPLKLKLWPAQRKIVPLITQSLLLILLKTRQVGLTWLSAAYVLWMAIRSPLFLAIIISASEDHAIEFLNRVYFIMDRLPKWMVPPIKSRTKMQIEFAHQDGSVATIKSMPTIEMGAESKTPNILIIDEAHTIREVSGIYNSSYPGIEAAKGQVIIIANSVKSGPGWGFVRDMYLNSKAGINQFVRIFLPWMVHPDRPKDFRERMERAGMSKEDVIWHYPETEDEAVSAIASSYFGDSLARHKHARPGIKGQFIRDKQTKVVRFEEKPGGVVELWRYPYWIAKGWDGSYWERRYAMGSDVSEGVGSSFSVAYLKDRKIDEIICKISSNRISAHEWAVQLSMMSDYYERAVITVERTGAGQTTVKRLEELKANQSVRMVSGRTGKEITKEYGWHESQQNKHELCGDLRRWLKEMKGVLWDAELIAQCQTWIEGETGKLGPEKGRLGDCVMAAGCTQQASQYLGPVEKIIPEGDGWLENWQKERATGGARAWAA
ncbi:MAG TPA: hypothetical protein VLH56_17310 [Dissulfurispiraceae bacterium]|nr:hypothetical protein [Dissulfurispiraceae bacterium]